MSAESRQPAMRLGRPGLVIDDRYRLERPLGLGGFGEVWRATQVVDDAAVRPVALKLLHPPGTAGAGGSEPSSRRDLISAGGSRWLDEVRAVRDVRCDSIVTIFDVGVSRQPEVAFIAMELLDGESVEERLARGPIPWRRALAIVRDIAAALDACHAVGVVHRDLKPQNIFVTTAGRVCVLDFGVAALGGDPAPVIAPPTSGELDDPAAGTGAVSIDELPGLGAVPAASHMVGTPGYVAPETLGGGSAAAAADVYAVGVLLYRMIAGRLPHRVPAGLSRPTRDTGRQEIDRYRAALVSATVHGDYLPLAVSAPTTPPAVITLVDRLMTADPEARPSRDLGAAVAEVWSRPFGAPDPPYAGLDAFGINRTGFIAGRDADIDYVATTLASQRVIVLSGPSGCGKSSLAIAGVAPRLDELLLHGRDGWRTVVLRPAENHAELAVVEGPAPAQVEVGVVVVVDQLEEVLGLGADERASFCAALASLAEGSATVALDGEPLPAGAVRVVATVRDDLFGRVAAIPELNRFPERNLYTVRGVEPNDVPEIVAGPARAAGYRLDGAAAVAAEATEILSEDASALPLVQFALTRWWEQRDREARVLTRDEWRKIGGIKGALAEVAQALYDGFGDDDRERMRDILIGLFRADGTRVRADEETLVPDAEPRAVLGKLLDRRLVRRHVDAEKRVWLEVAHEALAERWPPLHQWLEDTRAERELIQDLSYDAERWRKAGSPPEMLWSGRRLDAAVDRYPRLEPELQAFVGPAIRLRRRSKLQRRAIAAAVIAAIAGVLLLRYIDTARERRVAERARDEARAAAELSEELRLVAERQRDRADARANLLSLEKARTYLDDDPTMTVAWLQRLTAIVPEAATLAADAEDRGVALRVLRGHESHFASSGVNAVAWSPDQTLIASAGDDGTVRLWQTDTGEHRVLRGFGRAVVRVVFSADGARVAAASRDETVRVWQVADGAELLVGKHQRPVNDLAFSPDGSVLASVGEDKVVRVWNLSGGEETDLAGHSRSVNRVIFTADGRLATGGDDGDIRVWNLASGAARLFAGHTGAVRDLALSDDGRRLVSGGSDRTVRVWALDEPVAPGPADRSAASDPSDPSAAPDSPVQTVADPIGRSTALQIFRPGSRVNAVGISDDGTRVAAVSENGTVRVWDAATGETVLAGSHDDETVAVAFSPDGQRLASAGGHYKNGGDTAVRVWELQTGEARVLRGHADRVRAIAFSPDGRRLVSASADKTLRVWPVVPLTTRVLRGHRDSVWRLAFSPDGKVLASAGLDKAVRLWDLSTYTSQVLGDHESEVRRVVYSPDGRYLASATRNGYVRVFDREGKLVKKVRGHTEAVIHIDFSPDSRLLATCGADDRIRLYHLDSDQSETFTGHDSDVNHIAFSPDGKSLASGGQDARVLLWDVATGDSRELDGHEQAVTHLEFSPDGSRLATTGADKKVLLWDLASGTSQSLGDPANPIGDRIDYVTFSPDGSVLAAAVYDSTVRVFDLSGATPPRTLRGHTDAVYKVVFSTRGVLASSSADDTVRLWDLETGESRVLRGHRDNTMHLAFSPDGDLLASTGYDQTIRLWPVVLPRRGDDLRRWLDTTTAERIDGTTTR